MIEWFKNLFKREEPLPDDHAFVAAIMGYSEKEFKEILKQVTFDDKHIKLWKDKNEP